MNKRILWVDDVAEMAYIYLLSSRVEIPVTDTKESAVTPAIVFDYAENGRVVGIELYELYYRKLRQMPDGQLYTLTETGYYWGFAKPETTFDFEEKGLTFHFSDPLFEEFIGYTVNDTKLYSSKVLKHLTK